VPLASLLVHVFPAVFISCVLSNRMMIICPVTTDTEPNMHSA